MTDNVVSLSGSPIVPAGAVDQNLVEECERLLEMARAGAMRAIVYAIRHPDDATSCANIGTMSMALSGELHYLANRVASRVRD